MMPLAALEAEIQALHALDLNSLRETWRSRYGPPPRIRSTDLIRRMLAWRIQAEALGGLDRPTREALRRRTSAATRARLPVGSRISREWRGVRHEVEVAADGYLYAGETHRSLSVIATRITGSRWNGWRFFGLADPVRAATQ